MPFFPSLPEIPCYKTTYYHQHTRNRTNKCTYKVRAEKHRLFHTFSDRFSHRSHFFKVAKNGSGGDNAFAVTL